MSVGSYFINTCRIKKVSNFVSKKKSTWGFLLSISSSINLQTAATSQRGLKDGVLDSTRGSWRNKQKQLGRAKRVFTFETFWDFSPLSLFQRLQRGAFMYQNERKTAKSAEVLSHSAAFVKQKSASLLKNADEGFFLFFSNETLEDKMKLWVFCKFYI